MADIKFSEFPKANQSKDSDEIAILQDGVNKMIASPVLESKIINKTVSRVIDQGGASLNVINLKGVVPTYADLALITPTPELNDAYQVESDGLVYVYTENGFQSEGSGFVVQPDPTGVVEEGNTQAVSGGGVFESQKYINLNALDSFFKPYVVVNGVQQASDIPMYINLIDSSINKLSLIISKLDTYKFTWLKTFNLKKISETQLQCTIIITVTNNLDDSITSNEISTVADAVYIIHKNNEAVVYGSSEYGNFELIINTSKYEIGKQYQFSTVKKEGLIQSGIINYIYPQYFRDNIKDQYLQYKGNSFAFYRGVRNITFNGNNKNKQVRLTRFEKTASSIIIDFNVYDLISKKVTVCRKQYTHAEFVGILKPTLVAFSGNEYNNADYGLSMTIDADYMNKHYGNQTYKIEPLDVTLPMFHYTDVTDIQICDLYDFEEAGYSDYRGMWYDNGNYRRMPIGKVIPTGSVKLIATGGFDKNANVLFGDKNGLLIGYAWVNEDGTKYSGDEVKTKIEANIPNGAKYFHASTRKTEVNNATVRFQGVFNFEDKKDFDLIQDAILNNHVKNNVFFSGNFTFRKNGNNVNNVNILSADNLSLVDNYHSDSIVRKGQGKGQLAYFKDDKYYYYNGGTREIYYELNGSKTVITSPTLHANSWVNSIAQAQERTVIEVLEDNSILFAMKEQLPNGNIVYSLWKVIEGQEPLKKFMYSNNFFTKPDNTTQSANGCPLGDWSFAKVKDLIFATEYGQGTSEWWYNKGESGGNGKGVSSRVWVSNDNGDSWSVCLNLSELKNNTLPISDTNWKYFTDTNAKNYCHIHFIKYDNFGDRIYLSNGDGENFLWSVDYNSVKTFSNSAPKVNPNTILNYTEDSGLTWNAVKLCNYTNQPNINYHNMKLQMTSLYPTEAGLLLGHDAPREFMYFAHRKGILQQSTFRIEPTYNWENRNDFDTDSDFKSSKDKTDGFVMAMTRNKKPDPILIFHSASGKYCRIWATYNGFSHKIVFESDKLEIQFGCRVFFDKTGNIILSTGSSLSSNDSGYFNIKIY